MDTVPEILKQKLICRCCKNIQTITVNSKNNTKNKPEKKLIITWEKPQISTPPISNKSI